MNSLRASWHSVVQPTAEVAAGLRIGVLAGLAALVLCVPPHRGVTQGAVARVQTPLAAVASAPARPTEAPRQADFTDQTPSPDARRLANWVANSRDNHGAPFVVLDKLGARVFVFDPQARLMGSTLVLLGSAPGDDSPPGIGDRPLAQIRSDERTTPAGRFVSVPGHDETGDDVVWVDYDNSVAMHRVKVVDPKERRFERIATNSVEDKRISNGCINVPISFYDQFIATTLGHGKALVYILPEVKPLGDVFPALAGALVKAAVFVVHSPGRTAGNSRTGIVLPENIACSAGKRRCATPSPPPSSCGWGNARMFGRIAPVGRRVAVVSGWCLGLLLPFAANAAPADAEFTARWVTDHADNHGQPFAIVDKRDARLYVYSADGALAGDSPVLLGQQPGDDAIRDIALRSPRQPAAVGAHHAGRPLRLATGPQPERRRHRLDRLRGVARDPPAAPGAADPAPRRSHRLAAPGRQAHLVRLRRRAGRVLRPVRRAHARPPARRRLRAARDAPAADAARQHPLTRRSAAGRRAPCRFGRVPAGAAPRRTSYAESDPRPTRCGSARPQDQRCPRAEDSPTNGAPS